MEISGLDSDTVEAPEVVDQERLPIDTLAPGTDAHARVLSYLLKRLDLSEEKMSDFYPRWQLNEMKVQAYVDLADYEKIIKQANDKGEAPQVTSIVMPYAFATLATIVTYLIQAFCGRKPLFQVSTYDDKKVEAAQAMETFLQYNAEHVRLTRSLFQFFNDGELYGVQVLRTPWRKDVKKRSIFRSTPKTGWLGIPLGNQMIRTREDKTVFEGTDVICQDPFMFFPDPRVPMSEVSSRGEFVFWRTFEGKHLLKQVDGFKYIDSIGKLTGSRLDKGYGTSNRSLLSNGQAQPGRDTQTQGLDFIQVDQGTIILSQRNWD